MKLNEALDGLKAVVSREITPEQSACAPGLRRDSCRLHLRDKSRSIIATANKLLLFIFFISLNAAEKQVKIQSSELQAGPILISELAANESTTLRNMLEGVKAEEASLPLPYSYNLVSYVVELLELIKNNRIKQLGDYKIKINLVDKLRDKSIQELVDLTNFVNFLDIPILLDALFVLLGKKASEDKINFYTIVTELNEDLLPKLVNNLLCSFDKKTDDRRYASASISADGSSIIATGFDDSYLYLFKDGTVTKLADPSDTNRRYWSSSISADGSSIIATGHDDYYIYLFKDGTVTKLVDPSDTNARYTDLSISADGSSIVARGFDTYLYLFKDGTVTKLVDPSDTNRRYGSPSISADGSSIIVTGIGGYLYLFKDGAITKLEDPSDTNRIYGSPSISADGSSIIVTGSYYNYLYLFKDGAVTKLEDPSDTYRIYSSTSISADGSSIIARGSDKYLYLFKDGAVIKLAAPYDINRRYTSLSTSADGSSIVATGSDDKYLYLFTKLATLKKLISDLDESQQKIVNGMLEVGE